MKSDLPALPTEPPGDCWPAKLVDEIDAEVARLTAQGFLEEDVEDLATQIVKDRYRNRD